MSQINQKQENMFLKKVINRLQRQYKHTLGDGLRFSLLYLNSLHLPSRYHNIFPHIKKVCLFIGYPRSGHSLIGSLIDAHPDAMISHELDAVKLMKMGFSRQQIFFLALNNSETFSKKGRMWTGYSYEVPGQYQGKFKDLKVIGDKCGNQTTLGLESLGGSFDLLRKTFGENIYFLHVVRNPFDNIATMKSRGPQKMDLQHYIDVYFKLCESNKRIIETVGEDRVLTIWHESVIKNPQETIKKICLFLSLDILKSHVDDCSSLIFENTHKSRYKIQWSQEQINFVMNRIKDYTFLNHYSYHA